MRKVLIDWIIDVATNNNFHLETLHKSVMILDSYLMKDPDFHFNKLQLLGCISMLIATKLEEYYVLTPKDLSYLTCETYSVDEIIQFEQHVLEKIDYNVYISTLYKHYTSYMTSLYKNSNHTKMISTLNIILFHVDILYNYEFDDIVESCKEIIDHEDKYYSNCIKTISEKINSLEEKYMKTLFKHKYRE